MNKLPIAFMDLFVILLVNIIVLFVLAVLLIRPKDSEIISVKPKQEFLITTTWDSSVESNSDVDMWIMRKGNPNSRTGFSRRENDVFILHNDNVGSMYGYVDGETLVEARETLTIEQIKADIYYLSLHGYAIRTGTREIEVRVEIEKLNPYELVYSKDVIVFAGQERRIARWEIDKDGNVIKFDDKLLLRKIL